jgi:heptosyltransferase II
MKVLIELPTWLGDSVMVTPAINNLTTFLQNSEISLIGSKISIEIFLNHPQVVESHVLDSNYINLYKFVRNLGNFDAFISFRSSYRSKFIKFLVISKNKFQFSSNLYKKGHQVEKYNRFINDSFNINVLPSKLQIYSQYKIKNNKTKLLGISPGATYGSAKRWYPEQYAAVAIELSTKYDIIILGGNTEIDIAGDIEKHLKNKGIKNFKNLVAKTSIQELIMQISNLDLFITADSGPMHIAAAYKIPTVAIFGPTKEEETSQWMNEKGIVVKKNLKCQPCMQRTCPLMHHECMRLIKSKDVLRAIEKLSLEF